MEGGDNVFPAAEVSRMTGRVARGAPMLRPFDKLGAQHEGKLNPASKLADARPMMEDCALRQWRPDGRGQIRKDLAALPSAILRDGRRQLPDDYTQPGRGDPTTPAARLSPFLVCGGNAYHRASNRVDLLVPLSSLRT